MGGREARVSSLGSSQSGWVGVYGQKNRHGPQACGDCLICRNSVAALWARMLGPVLRAVLSPSYVPDYPKSVHISFISR